MLTLRAPGFGRPLSWTEDARIPSGHTLTFKDALHIVSSNLRIKILTPSWLMPWRAQWRLIDEAHKDLRVRKPSSRAGLLTRLARHT